MRTWRCARCHGEQVGLIPPGGLCHGCADAAAVPRRRDPEEVAEIPARYRGLSRASWVERFRRPWPAKLAQWTGEPPWVALHGPTGTGKTGLATVLLAEHVRAGRGGRWLSGADLARRIQLDFQAGARLLTPYLSTALLVFDEPLAGAAADWYLERVSMITRHRDERGLPTIVTQQELPELLLSDKARQELGLPPLTTPAPPPLLSRWLSGIRIFQELAGDDVRLR